MAAALASLCVLGSAAAFARSGPVPLLLWGQYTPPIAGCQRTIGHAAAWCSARVIALRAACATARLRDEGCDAAVDTRVAAVRSHAAALVEAACTDRHAGVLQFADRSEAVRDVTTACREAEDAVLSAAFGPALAGGSVTPVGGAAGACLEATGRAATHLMRLAVRLRRRAVDYVGPGCSGACTVERP